MGREAAGHMAWPCVMRSPHSPLRHTFSKKCWLYATESISSIILATRQGMREAPGDAQQGANGRVHRYCRWTKECGCVQYPKRMLGVVLTGNRGDDQQSLDGKEA